MRALPSSFTLPFHHPPSPPLLTPSAPGANVPGNLTNAPRTDWPLTGGSVVLDLHHPWTYLFINLGLGANAANFNYTLTDPFLNVTGNGTFCIPKLNLPANLPVSDGSLGSLQVVTVGEDGNALYNCADITFRTSAGQLEGDKCKSSEGVSAEEVKEQPAPSAGSTLSGNRMGLLMGVMGAVAVVVGLA